MHVLSAIMVTATEETSSGLSLVLPEPAELVAGILAFAIVFFFIWKWALPTINQTLEARQKAVAGQMTAAEKAKQEAESLLADYKAQLADSKAEGNRMIEEARGTAEQMRAELLAKAEADAEKILAKAREEAESERDRALADARTQVGSISVDLASQIVGESLDAKTHEALVNRYLADLEKL